MKNILICVAGATPQVITETIYALSRKSPPVHIDELNVITTAFGKKLITERLIKDGVLERLLREYALPSVKFTEEDITVINDSGKPLDDIRNDLENELTGDVITNIVRKVSERDDSVLHCSIAGGRKTMSFYLGAALQLFGRPQDRLYHVLISSEFENNPEFFYPPRRPRRLKCRTSDGKERLISTSRAEVHLAELPYVRLRGRVWLEGKTFRELVSKAEEGMRLSQSHYPLRFDFNKIEVIIGDERFQFQPMLYAVYALFAEEKKRYCRFTERENCLECSECFMQMSDLSDDKVLDRIRALYARIYGRDSLRLDDERWQKYKKQGGIPQDTLRQHISKINRIIKEHFPNPELYEVRSMRRYGASKYGIRVDKSRISLP
jgi:CRISPR-associated protein (TIGR02584 family)